MAPVPMCPGCRALLSPGESACPYCGWNVAATEVRREGGLVERTARKFGGVVNLLIFANALLAVLLVVVQVRVVRRMAGDPPDTAALLLDGILSPDGRIVVLMGSVVPGFVLAKHEAWRLLTAVFLHFGILHIGVNMMSLRNIGGLVEEAYGSGKALALYLLSGLAGTAAGIGWYALKPHLGLESATYNAAGASGAICGYAGLLAALGFRIGGPRGRALWTSMVKAVGFIIVLGVILSMSGGSWRLDNLGHAGGFLFGLGAGFVCSFGVRARGSPAAVRAWDAAAVLLALLTAAAFVPPALAVAEALR